MLYNRSISSGDTMDPKKESGYQPFRFSDPRQERIYGRLRLVGPGPAAFYRDACWLMAAEPPIIAAAHLVSHLLREIESALRDVLEPLHGHTENTNTGGKSKDDTHKAEIYNILKALEIPDTDPVAKAWLRLPGKSNDYGLAARAHRDALLPPRQIDHEFQIFWAEIETVFDVVLERFESCYLQYHQRLDKLLAKAIPTQVDIDLLREQVPNNLVALGYFFDKLPSAAWLRYLKAGGFFKHPPEPERDEDKGLVRFPIWPESRYLARMASQDPKTVLEIVLQIPDTDNIRVHIDIVNAALAMPPEHAAKLVSRVATWIESPYQLLVPEKVGELVAHLAQGGQVDKALELARSLLAVRLHEFHVSETEGLEPVRLMPEVLAHFHEWHYREILQRHVPTLVTAGGERALILLCDLLDSAIGLSRGHVEGDESEDHSYIWRPAVEDNPQNWKQGIEDALVSAVRDAATQIAQNDPATVPALVQTLEQHRRPIFYRLALYVLSEFSDQAVELVTERLTDRARFDDFRLRHEYTLLAQKSFPALPAKQKRKILSWIKEGPDLTWYVVGQEAQAGQTLKDEDAERYTRRWQRNRLAPLSSALPSKLSRIYKELVAEFGPAEHPEFPVYSSGVRVHDTRVTGSEQLQAMQVKEIISFLKSWQPPGGFMNPSTEDLGCELTTAVAADPDRFAVEAVRFHGLDPDYISGFICGFRDATQGGKSFSWLPVLNLCRWVVDQSEAAYTEEQLDLRPRWRWARKSIADLLTHGFSGGVQEIPFDLRSIVWEVLQPLTDDPDPTPDDEARDDGSLGGFYGLSINTTRGHAMHAVIYYALWVRRHVEELAGDKERIAAGFNEMPEVQAILDRHLDPDRDPSRSIRAVYGRFFPWLLLLDSQWAAASVSKIFPNEEAQRDLHDAAWETYITSCPADDNVFDILSEQYVHAINLITMEPKENRRVPDPDERLAEHFMALYWRGKLKLDEPEGILKKFYVKASDTLRGHALAFVGRVMYNTEGAVAPQRVKRNKVLWERRLDVARTATVPGEHASELAAFGWWFVSAKLDDAWAIMQLAEALKITGRVDADHLVVEHLASLAPSMPVPVLECLSLMIDGDVEGWHIDVWREHVWAILDTALQSSEQTVQMEARSLVNRLAARGHLDFGDLLR